MIHRHLLTGNPESENQQSDITYENVASSASQTKQVNNITSGELFLFNGMYRIPFESLVCTISYVITFLGHEYGGVFLTELVYIILLSTFLINIWRQ